MKPFYTLVFSLILGGLALAQPGGPSMQVQGSRGSVNLGIGPDGRPSVNATGQRGSVQIQGASPDWRSVAPISNAASPADQGVFLEYGPQGKTVIHTREGTYTLDNWMLQPYLPRR